MKIKNFAYSIVRVFSFSLFFSDVHNQKEKFFNCNIQVMRFVAGLQQIGKGLLSSSFFVVPLFFYF